MEKKKDYNYLIQLFFEWNAKNHFSIDIQTSEIRILDSEDEVFIFFKNTDINEYNKAIEYLEEQLQPTYEDALQFIIDNEDKGAKWFVSYNDLRGWCPCQDVGFINPFLKYMTEDKCKEFIEKFKNVKPKA